MPPKQASKGGKKEPAKKPMKPKEGGGGKAKKKKWSKGKVRDKLNNMVLFDKATFDKLLKEVPQYKVITPSVVSERLKIRASLARHALEELWRRGMRLNRETVVETTRLFLVPYLATHVTKYHRWMQCSWLRESTSSESLSLDEEFEAQKQWCNSDDRLTFILLSKQLLEEFWSLKSNQIKSHQQSLYEFVDDENPEVYAMIGDVNLFLTPGIGDDDFEGELSVMIAESKFRGQRLAAEALAGILEYSGRHLPVDLTSLVAKVSVNNEGSVKFFKERLQFIERSRNNIFNEIEFIPDVENLSSVEINSSEFKNQLALKTSQAIINRLLATSPELSASSTWYYKENELKIWRDKQKK